jgi:hypothetical protein
MENEKKQKHNELTRRYYKENRDDLLKNANKLVVCDICNVVYTQSNKWSHEKKNMTHINAVEQYKHILKQTLLTYPPKILELFDIDPDKIPERSQMELRKKKKGVLRN